MRKRISAMNWLFSIALAWTVLSGIGLCDVALHETTRVRFATVEEGVAAITKRDRFVASMSRFDRQSRLCTDREVSEAEYLEFVGNHVVAWQQDEIDRVTVAIHSIDKKLEPFSIPLPHCVLIVKTTGQEEAGAAYCRGNAIVFPERMLTWSQERLEKLLTHELFHITSTQSTEMRLSLYAVIGFRQCDEIQLPEGLRDRKITNPDGPTLEYYIELKNGETTVNAMPVLFASVDQFDPQKSRSFFRQLEFKLMAVQCVAGKWSPLLKEGGPVLIDVRPDTAPSFYEQVGQNTDYIIHPDEILAENFVHLINGTKDLPSPRIAEEMGKLLAKGHAR